MIPFLGQMHHGGKAGSAWCYTQKNLIFFKIFTKGVDYECCFVICSAESHIILPHTAFEPNGSHKATLRHPLGVKIMRPCDFYTAHPKCCELQIDSPVKFFCNSPTGWTKLRNTIITSHSALASVTHLTKEAVFAIWAAKDCAVVTFVSTHLTFEIQVNAFLYLPWIATVLLLSQGALNQVECVLEGAVCVM